MKEDGWLADDENLIVVHRNLMRGDTASTICDKYYAEVDVWVGGFVKRWYAVRPKRGREKQLVVFSDCGARHSGRATVPSKRN